MSVFKTANERAEDAQSAFIAFLITGAKNREECKALLESLFSTAKIAEKNAYGIMARTTHVAYGKRPENKMFFETLEHQVWRLYAAGTSPEVVYGAVRSAGATKELDFLPYAGLITRVNSTSQERPARLATAR